MNDAEFFRGGAGSSWAIRVGLLRWGGGAQPGTYHMFLMAEDVRAGLPLVSAHCVVDDFGDLVEVPR